MIVYLKSVTKKKHENPFTFHIAHFYRANFTRQQLQLNMAIFIEVNNRAKLCTNEAILISQYLNEMF